MLVHMKTNIQMQNGAPQLNPRNVSLLEIIRCPISNVSLDLNQIQ